MNKFTPAALVAIDSGDLDNFLGASTPGGIERQEAEGQAEMAAAANILPKDIINRGITYEMLAKAWGVKFIGDHDEIFFDVQLPNGWDIRPTEHSMYSDLIDQDGSVRAEIFYKAAFYDCRADMSIKVRYNFENDYGKPVSKVTVRDNKTGAVLAEFGPFNYSDLDASAEAERSAIGWLNHTFPSHADPLAYWDNRSASAQ